MIGLPPNRFVAVLPVYFKTSELQLALSVSYISFCQSLGRGEDTVLNFITHGTPLHIIQYTIRVLCVFIYVHVLINTCADIIIHTSSLFRFVYIFVICIVVDTPIKLTD